MSREVLTQADALNEIQLVLPGLLAPHVPSYTSTDVFNRAIDFRHTPFGHDFLNITATLDSADLALYAPLDAKTGMPNPRYSEVQTRLFAYDPDENGVAEWSAQMILGGDNRYGRDKLFCAWHGGAVAGRDHETVTPSDKFYIHFVDQGTSLSIDLFANTATVSEYDATRRSHSSSGRRTTVDLASILGQEGEGNLAELYKNNHIKITHVEHAEDGTIAITYAGYPKPDTTNTIIIPGSLNPRFPHRTS